MKRVINAVIKLILQIICKIDSEALEKVPAQGPLIVAANHVNFLDAPVMITYLAPRRTTGLIKKETWDNPFLAFLFNIWEGIPIDRDLADFTAFRKAQQALDDAMILAVAPEGTRTKDGILIRGKPGITLLAVKTGVPILPVAYYGHENFLENINHLKRTPMHIRVGEPFRVNLEGHQKNKALMQDVTDAIMLRIAALMPEKYRGYYRDFESRGDAFLEGLD